MLAVAEQSDQVRRFSAGSWQELSPIAVTGRVDAVAFRPRGSARACPCCSSTGTAATRGGVVRAGGRHVGGGGAGRQPAAPDRRVLPRAAGPRERATSPRSITDDAQDILAMIEGGLDSRGARRSASSTCPRTRRAGRVAIVGLQPGHAVEPLLSEKSHGHAKERGDHRGGVRVARRAQPRRGRRAELRNGLQRQRARSHAPPALRGARRGRLTQTCGQCPAGTPIAFSTNQPGDDTFITDLNGHGLGDSCTVGFTSATEAPSSRPTLRRRRALRERVRARRRAGGRGHAGRRLLRASPRAEPGAPTPSTSRSPASPPWCTPTSPTHWLTICTALRTVTDHQAPDPAQACTGLTHP